MVRKVACKLWKVKHSLSNVRALSNFIQHSSSFRSSQSLVEADSALLSWKPQDRQVSSQLYQIHKIMQHFYFYIIFPSLRKSLMWSRLVSSLYAFFFFRFIPTCSFSCYSHPGLMWPLQSSPFSDLLSDTTSLEIRDKVSKPEKKIFRNKHAKISHRRSKSS